MRAPRRLHDPIGFEAQPTNHFSLGFETQIKKLLQ
jgi:hypothetical protein